MGMDSTVNLPTTFESVEGDLYQITCVIKDVRKINRHPCEEKAMFD